MENGFGMLLQPIEVGPLRLKNRMVRSPMLSGMASADGEVTEGTRANFFIFIGRKLITPREGVLFGITRKAVLDLARDEFEVFEAPVRYDELRKADEAFLTSTTKEVLPVVCVDDITIGTGKPGPNTLRLLARFRDAVLGGR